MRYLFYILLLISFIQCSNEQSNGLLSRSDVRNIKKGVSEKAIRYLGETALSIDIIAPWDNSDSLYITKWGDDILLKLEDAQNLDSLAVYNAIKELNSVQLPIKIKLAHNNKANLTIYFNKNKETDSIFGKEKSYNHAPFISNGLGILSREFGIIKHGNIFIQAGLADEKLYFIVLHELLNSLGLVGDSSSDLNSIIYEGERTFYSCKLGKLEIECLQLLYSPYLIVGFTRADYKKCFPEYYTDSKVLDADYQKFDRLVSKKYKENCLITFLDFCCTQFSLNSKSFEFNEAHIIKPIAGNMLVAFDAGISNENKLIFYKAIKTLNKYLPSNNKIKVADKNKNALIFITQNDTDRIISNEVASTPSHYNISSAKINIIHADKFSNKTKERLFIRYLLSSMNLNNEMGHIESSSIFNNNKLELAISKTDKRLINLYFSPTMRSGMSKAHLKDIINKYYPVKDCYSNLEDIIKAGQIPDSIIKTFRDHFLTNNNEFKKYNKTNLLITLSDNNSIDSMKLLHSMNILSKLTGIQLEWSSPQEYPDLIINEFYDLINILFPNVNVHTLIMFEMLFYRNTQYFKEINEAIKLYYSGLFTLKMSKKNIREIFHKHYDIPPFHLNLPKIYFDGSTIFNHHYKIIDTSVIIGRDTFYTISPKIQ